jgi:hypothetical protein
VNAKRNQLFLPKAVKRVQLLAAILLASIAWGATAEFTQHSRITSSIHARTGANFHSSFDASESVETTDQSNTSSRSRASAECLICQLHQNLSNTLLGHALATASVENTLARIQSRPNSAPCRLLKEVSAVELHQPISKPQSPFIRARQHEWDFQASDDPRSNAVVSSERLALVFQPEGDYEKGSEISSNDIIQFSDYCLVVPGAVNAQALSAGSVTGAVVDPNGAVVPNASVTLANPITGYKRTTSTDTEGSFRFSDVPPNNYQLAVSATGFSAATQTLTVRTAVPINLKIPLDVGNTAETVTVTGSAGPGN